MSIGGVLLGASALMSFPVPRLLALDDPSLGPAAASSAAASFVPSSAAPKMASASPSCPALSSPSTEEPPSRAPSPSAVPHKAIGRGVPLWAWSDATLGGPDGAKGVPVGAYWPRHCRHRAEVNDIDASLCKCVYTVLLIRRAASSEARAASCTTTRRTGPSSATLQRHAGGISTSGAGRPARAGF